MSHSSPQEIRLDPPLVESEIAFLDAFSGERDLRRVWPGQPSRHCPWRPKADGSALVLDPVRAAAEPETVVGWLRFLAHQFLAPSSAESLAAALTAGLRGGHHLWGVVLVGEHREIRAERSRINERILVDEPDATVIDFAARREQHAPTRPGGGRQVRCVDL